MCARKIDNRVINNSERWKTECYNAIVFNAQCWKLLLPIGKGVLYYLIYIRLLTPPPRYSAFDMCLMPVWISKNHCFVPCGKCVECKIQYAEEWARRVVLEAKKYDKNCFITLTYNDANLPKGGVCKRSAQLFMKRLRKAIEPLKVRYFLCGEYGSEKNRPHYHCILFGFDFDDKYYFGTDRRGNAIYRSPLLEKLWTFGFSSVGDKLDFESAKYCAKYMQADGREFEALGLAKPFVLMSRRPGLALDVIPEITYKTGDIYFDGKRYKAPRAFKKVIKEAFIDKETGEINLPSWYDFKPDLSLYGLNGKVNRELSLEKRRKKYEKIFGKSLDKQYRIVVSLKRGGTVRKT